MSESPITRRTDSHEYEYYAIARHVKNTIAFSLDLRIEMSILLKQVIANN